MESRNCVYYTMGVYADFDARVTDWVNLLRKRGASGVHTPHEFVALDHLLHDMRLYKSRAEVSAMRGRQNRLCGSCEGDQEGETRIV